MNVPLPPPLPPTPSGAPSGDAASVAAYLAGDRSALAAIYDRHAASLYDTAAAMLRDRHEAADVVQDVFLVAAERLDQLRDQERLKPWLFAVLRNEVFKRSKRRGRQRPVDFSAPETVEMAAPVDPAAEGGALAAAELAVLLRDAAAGLDERDQLVLELTTRQGLAGEDLADALGVSPDQSYVLVHRMRERVERSLGALLVARIGRRDCVELAGILTGWDGRFNVLIRKRVARHVDSCAVCERTSKAFAVLPLIGTAPAIALPVGHRELVLGRLMQAVEAARLPVDTGPASGTQGLRRRDPGYRFDAPHGFPTPVRRGVRPAVAVALAALATLLLLVIGALVVSGGSDSSAPAVSDPATTVPADTVVETAPPTEVPTTVPPTSVPETTVPPTTAPETTVPETTAPETTAPPTTAAPADPLIIPPSAPPPPPPPPSPATTVPSAPPTPSPTTLPPATVPPPDPGRLVLSLTAIDFGTATSVSTFTLSNDGDLPVSYTFATGGLAPFSVTPTGGEIAPGGATLVQVTLNRSGLTEGDLARSLGVSSSGSGGGTIALSARIEVPPVVSRMSAPTAVTICPRDVPVAASADVTDASGLTSVVLSWVGPGPAGSAAMSGSGSTYSGSFTGTGDGRWTLTVTATDTRGNTASASRTIDVFGCTIIG